MSKNETNAYSLDLHIAEIYDQHETHTDDIKLIRKLTKQTGHLRILEPFCGTGRILIPLATAGHNIVGIDQSQSMLDLAQMKTEQLAPKVQRRITLRQADVTTTQWPKDFDLVLLSSNCFYELASPDEQQDCIASVAEALKPGGYVYVDNDHMEGELDESWRHLGEKRASFPCGTCSDGTRLEATTETISFDLEKRLWMARRVITLTSPDGIIRTTKYIQQKHPVSFNEVKRWLEKYHFAIKQTFGDHAGNPYTPESGRAIFWARKESKQ